MRIGLVHANVHGSMEDALYWIQPGKVRDPFITSKDILMTYLDIVFRYGARRARLATGHRRDA